MTDEMGVGARAERARRRKFWGVIGGLAVGGAITGIVAGYVGAHQAANGVTGVPPALAYLVVAAAIAAVGFGCWLFYKNIDEVEMADNLWASSWAVTTYIVVLPAWAFLRWAEAAPEPSHWAIYYLTLGVGFVAYVWLKIRRR